jgi:hypothetical protein
VINLPSAPGPSPRSGSSSSSAGALILLEEHTASASASLNLVTRNVTGQSGAAFQSDYDTYDIEIIGIVPASNTILQFLVSADGGSTWDSTAAHYAWSANYSSQGGNGGIGANSAAAMLLRDVNTTLAAGGNFKGTYRLYNPLSASLFKAMTGQTTVEDANFTILNWAGFYRQTTAFNAIQLIAQSGAITSGTIRLYGVAK